MNVFQRSKGKPKETDTPSPVVATASGVPGFNSPPPGAVAGVDKKDKRRSLLALLMPSKSTDRREKVKSPPVGTTKAAALLFVGKSTSPKVRGHCLSICL